MFQKSLKKRFPNPSTFRVSSAEYSARNSESSRSDRPVPDVSTGSSIASTTVLNKMIEKLTNSNSGFFTTTSQTNVK